MIQNLDLRFEGFLFLRGLFYCIFFFLFFIFVVVGLYGLLEKTQKKYGTSMQVLQAAGNGFFFFNPVQEII